MCEFVGVRKREYSRVKEPVITVFIRDKYCVYNFYIQTSIKALLGLCTRPKVREVCNTFEFAYEADK